MKKILITDFVHQHLILGLQTAGFIVDFDVNVNNKKLKKIVDQYYGIIINSKITADKALMKLAPQLRFIGRLGSGLEIIDLPEAHKNNIAVLNTPEGNCNAVAEHAFGMLLSLMNNLMIANQEIKVNKLWNRESNRGLELDGKTIGIIGFGHTGSSFAKKFQAWNVKVLAYDKYQKRYADDLDWVIETNMDQIYQEADIISLHLPLTEETKEIINTKFINNFQKPIILINTSRGKMVNLNDLIIALKAEKLKAVALDVLPNEKLQSYTKEEFAYLNELISLPNVLLTPHIAGWTFESLFKIADSLLNKIIAL